MSRNKNIKVFALPIDLLKEKDRPTAAAGTVGKWGQMGFTSIRNSYGQSYPSTQSSPSAIGNTRSSLDNDPSFSVATSTPKPKKFFKSRNTTNPQPSLLPQKSVENAQSPQQGNLFQQQSYPAGFYSGYGQSQPIQTTCEAIAAQIPKPKGKRGRPCKKKTDIDTKSEPPPKQIEIPKELMENIAPGKRGRPRKVVNYNETEEQTTVLPKPPMVKPETVQPQNPAEHPPIVLRISKGTSRLISTDSEAENNSSPTYHPQSASPPINYRAQQQPQQQQVQSDSEDRPELKLQLAPVPVQDEEDGEEDDSEEDEVIAHPPSPPQLDDDDIRLEESPVEDEEPAPEPVKIKIKVPEEKPIAIAPKLRQKRQKKEVKPKPEPVSRGATRTTRAQTQKKEAEDLERSIQEQPRSPEPGSENYELYRTLAASPSPEKEEQNIVQTEASVENKIDVIVEKPLPKKRGRKKKVVNEVQQPVVETPIVPETVEEPVEIKSPTIEIPVPKKRGRKPKAKPTPVEVVTPTKAVVEQYPIETQGTEEDTPSKRRRSQRGGPTNTQVAIKTPEIPSDMDSSPEKSPVKEIVEAPVPAPIRSYGRKRKAAPEPTKETTPTKITNGNNNNTELNYNINLNKKQSEKDSDLNNSKASDASSQGQLIEADNCEIEEEPNPKQSSNAQAGVKLVISKKKGSIFKSRTLVSDSEQQQAKKRYMYKHKWDDEFGEEESNVNEEGGPSNSKSNEKDNLTSLKPGQREKKSEFDEIDGKSGPVSGTSRLPPKSRTKTKAQEIAMDFEDEEEEDEKGRKKKFYTVVRNVKQAHQIQEIGEFQEMDDDVEYILDTLKPRNPMSTRCLSAIQLSTKCMTPAFRMHVRAHGTVQKFFRALQDASTDQSLGLCTATIMFVLSQDNMTMDLDRDSLELMLNLLESDVSHANALDDSGMSLLQLERNKKKVRELCEELKNQGKGAHLNLDNITVGTLAMETLLSLTSKRAGEWFKEELRNLGGLEHIIKTICECCRQISDYVVVWTESLLEKLRKIERCLRVLENVMEMNEQNQSYILNYDNGNAINILVKLYKLCDTEIALYPTTELTPKENPGVVIREALVPTLKVLIGLTHPFNDRAIGASCLGDKAEIFDTSLHLLFHSSNYVPENCIFELSLLVLLLLINLTTFTEANRSKIIEANALNDFGSQFDKVPAIKALVEFFFKCEELARMAEKNTDALLDSNPKKTETKNKDDMEETVTKILQKAGNHMEHTIMASYVALLIGYLVMDNVSHQKKVKSFLRPDAGYTFMAQILDKYYNFLNLTASSEATAVAHIKSTKRIIEFLRQCDQS